MWFGFSPSIVQLVQLLGGKARGWEVLSADSDSGGLQALVWDFLVGQDLLDLTMVRWL